MINNITLSQQSFRSKRTEHPSISTIKANKNRTSPGNVACADKAMANYNLAFISFKGTSNNSRQVLQEAKTVEELLKFRPDWKPEILRKKFAENNPYESFRIGHVPEAFGNKEIFDKFLSNIYQQIKSQPNQRFSKQYIFNDIEIDGRKFKVKSLMGGQTGKIILGVEPAQGEKYVVKYHPDLTCSSEKLDGGDTIGVQAVIDYFLSANNCEYSSKMFYYDDKNNASIYEWVEKDPDQSLVQNRLSHYQNPVPELQKYGIQFNDTMGKGNVFVRNGKPVMVDSGHCTFYDHNKPTDYELSRDLPNFIQFSCFMQ